MVRVAVFDGHQYLSIDTNGHCTGHRAGRNEYYFEDYAVKSIAILCIGDELLDGRVRDKNAHHLVQLLSRRAMVVQEIRIISDDMDSIVGALESCSGVDYVVVSGGLGPTADDITREAAAAFSGSVLEEDLKMVQRLRAAFESRGFPFTENNHRQCTFPSTATILATEVGSAAGFYLDETDTRYFFFPGVPSEFRWFVDRYLPMPGDAEIAEHSAKMTFFGLSESQIETKIIEAAGEARRRNIRVGYRADQSLIEVSLKGDRRASDKVEAMIRAQLGPWLVADGEESFGERLRRRLLDASATVSVAESCTAGLLAARLTEVSGSSQYFEEGYLTYANSAKERLVAVHPETLARFGAVSPQVVAQMAAGARRRSGATFALAISGIAGPSGGTTDKPVGTVDFALATARGLYHRRSYFTGRSREQVRTLSVHVAAALLLWHLENRLEHHNISGPFSDEEVLNGIQALPSE